jgi:hypothetical protein
MEYYGFKVPSKYTGKYLTSHYTQQNWTHEPTQSINSSKKKQNQFVHWENGIRLRKYNRYGKFIEWENGNGLDNQQKGIDYHELVNDTFCNRSIHPFKGNIW